MASKASIYDSCLVVQGTSHGSYKEAFVNLWTLLLLYSASSLGCQDPTLG